MASEQAIITGSALTVPKQFVLSAITAMPAAVIQYLGDKDYASITIDSDGNIILKADDTDGDTTTILTCDVSETAYNTFGKCRNAINQTEEFRCYLVGALPSSLSTVMLDETAIAQIGPTTNYFDNGKTIFFEQGTTAQVYGFAITNNKFTARAETETGDYTNHDKYWTKDANCINSLEYITLTVGNGAGTMTITAVRESDDNESVLYTEAFADDTLETHGSRGAAKPFIEAPIGHSLVITFALTTTTNDFDVVVISASGHTRSVVGDEVQNDNYTGCV